MSTKYWSLSNVQKQKGQLDNTRDFLGLLDKSTISCCQVITPITIDVKHAILAASNLVSKSDKNSYLNTTRSFEIWWDSSKKQLKIILASHSKQDLENFKISFGNMYPNASFVNLNKIIPDWYSPTKEKYEIFDASLYHGHYSNILDKTNSHQLITQIANTIQLADKACIQFVFAPYNFTPYLKSHLNRLNQKIKTVTSKKYRTWMDDITNKPSHENSENGLDFYNHYKNLQSDTAQKMQDSHVMMGIRGLIQSKNNSVNSLSFENVKSNYDHLTIYSYDYSKFYNKKSNIAGCPLKILNQKKNFQRISMFELRLLPSPRKYLEKSIKDYFEQSIIFGDYKSRKPLPFLILNPSELSLFIHLPNPTTTKNLQTTRNVSLPSKQTNKIGLNMGYFNKIEVENQRIYGDLVKSTDSESAVISPDDFSRHIYCVGGTGAGKTTLIRQIAKHLEISNLNGTFHNSFIYLDPKGDDSLKFVEQCQKESIENNNVHFLDPIKTNFSINPLELPKYSPEERQETVSRYVGYFMKIIKEWYNQQQSFVQMERIFRVLLFYMYLKNDAPTFLDMYDIIINLQEEQEKFLQVMFKALGIPGDELKQALTSIATLRPESFTPLLNRVEQFATDPILKKVFCVRHGTVKFEDLIKPGQYTIVRISALHIPHHVQPLAIQAFVIKLWFTIQERAARIENEKDRNYVILSLDEFQIVKDLQVLPMILSQARSYHLGLLLAHQTTAQISESLLEEITGNCGTQLAGRISGKDASKLANIWDPKFSKEISQQLASQEDFHWTIKMRASPGEEQPTPLQFWLHDPPKLSLNDEEMKEFIKNQYDLYGHGKVEESENNPLLQKYELQKNHWLRYITVDFISDKIQWQILVQLSQNKSLNLTDLTKNLQAKNRDDVSSILQEMLEKNLIVKLNKSRNIQYSLSKNTKKTYFTFNSRLIGTANDIPRVTRKVVDSYLKKGLFVTLALQKIEKGEDRTDLVAYSYDSEKSISIEIESTSELLSHPEHAIYNMRKWKKMGFDKCHSWSASDKLQEIYDKQIDDTENVKVFVV